MIGGHPIEVVENDLCRGCQGDARSAGNDVREKYADVVILLKAIHESLALPRGHLAGQDDCRRAERVRKLLERILKAREDDDLLTLLHGAADQFQCRGDLGDGDLLPRFRQDREQARAGALIAGFRITSGAGDEQIYDLTHLPGGDSCRVSRWQPCTQLRRK